MSMPRILKKEEILEKVKNELEKNTNLEVIKQVNYDLKPRGLPNLKTLSFILCKNKVDNTYKVAQTINLDIKHLSIEEFKAFDSSVLSSTSIKDYNNLCSTIDSLTAMKNNVSQAEKIQDHIENLREKAQQNKSSKENKPN